MMTTFKDLCASLGSVALLAFSANLAYGLKYQLSAPKVKAGERAIVEVRLPIPVNQQEVDELTPPEVNDDLLVQAKNFQLLERDFKRDKNDWVWRYEITAYQPGTVTIPPIEIRAPGENFSTESTPLEIITSREELDESLRPEFGPIKTPFPWLRIIQGAFLLALLNAAYYFAKRHFPKIKIPSRRQTPIIVPPPPKEDDREWLKRQLARLKSELSSPGDKGFVIDETTKVIREFYSRKTQAPVEAWTTQEFKKHFRDETATEKLAPLFERCDHFKFAGKPADAYAIAKETIEESERALLAC